MDEQVAQGPLSGGSGVPRLTAFEGAWTIARTIRHDDGAEARFTGRAVVRRSGPDLMTFDETGTLSQNGRAFHATRQYLWRAAPGGITVAFSDNRPFHMIHGGTLTPEAVHLCDPDRYAVAYDFTAWPEWRSVWTVEGPRKGYVMESVYLRA